MPEKNETLICATTAPYGIVAYHGLATLCLDWTLAPAPTQFGTREAAPQLPGQLCPWPAPATNWQEPLALCPFF